MTAIAKASFPEPATYDSIGVDYASQRRADPRIASMILEALGDAGKVLNVGSGVGSYEPDDRSVIALDPALTMLAQRGERTASAVQGMAEMLPFADGVFDAVMGLLTVHHWSDRRSGYLELCRVAPRRVVLTYEPAIHNQLWIISDYVPEIAALDQRRPGFCVTEVAEGIEATEVVTVPVPWDCTDGFLAAYWRRPEAYLDPRVRQSTSGFSLVSQSAVTRGLERLRADLASGAWDDRHAELRSAQELDTGFRLVVANS